MKPHIFLYNKSVEYTKEAVALRAKAAALDAKTELLMAAAREVDPFFIPSDYLANVSITGRPSKSA